MEEKRREPAPSAADSPASEPASSRRRAGANKRKSAALNASGSSSAPSKRAARDKASPLHPPPLHNGPLTRARQTPNSLAAASSSAAASAPAAVKHSERTHPSAADSAALAEQLRKESEWETLEAAIEAEFEALRSRGANAHVVPTHCGETLGTFSNPNLVMLIFWASIVANSMKHAMCSILCHCCSLDVRDERVIPTNWCMLDSLKLCFYHLRFAFLPNSQFKLRYPK